MEKIIVNPLEVRGLGNIVSPKTLEEFEVYNSSLSFEDNVYTLEYSPGTVSVALTVSSGSITIGESIVLEAIVTDDGVPLENVSVRFVTGNQVLGTDDTDVNGEASLTVSDLSVGSYSIYASANGQSSSPVSVTVSKLTSTITLSVPSTGTVGTSYTVSGTLVPSSGSVKLYENSVLKDTLTVSNGSFSKAITQSNEGTYSYYAVFEGSSTYSSVTSSTGSIVVSDVPTPTYDGITLTSDKSILSAYDSESATLTAQLMNGSSPALVAGETVTFEVRKTSDDSLVETLTGTTNSSGVATVSYLGNGTGDLYIQGFSSDRIISSEIFSLEDCILYDSLTSASGKWTVPSGVTSVYSNEGWKTSANAYKQIKLTDKLTNACTVEITIVDYYASDLARYPPIVMYQYTNGETTPNQQLIGLWNSSSFDAVGTRINHAIVKGGVYKIEYTSSNVKVYEDGTLLATASNSVGFPTRFEFHIGTNGRYAIYKDLKVKPL